MTIFVQIPSYRDAELGPTILDCLRKAKWPNELRFGLCIQDDLKTDYGVDFKDSRFRVNQVHWRESHGVCWARQQTQALYDDEEFTLHLDSHHRFVQDWDELLVFDFKKCLSERPVISTYPNRYDPLNNTLKGHVPNKILASRFGVQGDLRCYPLGFRAQEEKRPIPARFLSAGFLFTRGKFCEDVPYDPEFYFVGEEPSLAVRAFTHGYDFFHPQRNILWHEPSRESIPKHWFDHAPEFDVTSSKKNLIDQRRVAEVERMTSLLNGADFSFHGLGTERGVHDYERYAGLDFANNVVHQCARLGTDPIMLSDTEWHADNQAALALKHRLRTWFVNIDLSSKINVLGDFKACLLIFFDRDNQLIERATVQARKLQEEPLMGYEVKASAPPAYWVLTGFNNDRQWQRIGAEAIRDYRLLS